jgi:hypothetical protein
VSPQPTRRALDDGGDVPEVAIRWLLFLAALAATAFVAVRAWVGWRSGILLNPISGIWSALGLDLASGTLYRPLYSDEHGYGGTIYFPLHIVLDAGLIRLLGGPLAAGLTLTLLSGLAILFALRSILRSLGLSSTTAASLALLFLASRSAHHGFLSIRGDLLPTALTLWGFRLALSDRRNAAAVLFVAAFSAKVTAIHGPLATGVWWFLRGRRRDAFRLVALCAAGGLAVLAATQVASGGRFFDVVRSSAVSVSITQRLVKAPVVLLENVTIDSGGLPLVLCGAAVLLFGFRRRAPTLGGLYFLASAAVLLVVFGAPGADYNHLTDLVAGSLLVVGEALAGDRPASERRLLLSFAAAAAVLAIVRPAFWTLADVRTARVAMPRHDQIADIGRRSPRRMLSEDPLVPALLGQRPYVLDLFIYSSVVARDPSFERPLLDRMRRREFDVVVLRPGPRGKPSDDPEPFSPAFHALLEAGYVRDEELPNYWIYVPRGP